MPPSATPNPDHWAHLADVFDAVADLSEEERTKALDRLCRTPDGAPNPALRAEVESLLAADAEASTENAFEVADAAVLIEEDLAATPGERVGPWRVIRPIGRGGMGRVDLVERADGAYDQQAALKRLGVVAPPRVRRFLRERQILASLRHPGISRLLDGGVADGAPYLVMEYVEGEPITTYADRHGLGLRDRLALFVQVCDAVAYAHRRLVVHRDLKPSNVLVGERPEPATDGASATDSAHVTLLDFGVARLLDPDLADPITSDGAGAPLTPGYAAPEQIDGGEVTTATDVWSLGVLLYELVTDRLPFLTPSRDAWIDAVRRATPTLPSEVVRTASATGTTTPTADARRLRGDLDAICLTALRREPDARYASGTDLAADLRRYLAGEPVEARRPSAWYRIQRFAGRNRAGVAMSLVALLAVAAGTAFYTVRLAAERDRAQAARAEAEATSTFLEDVLGAASPFATDRRDTLRVADVIAGAAREVGSMTGQPARRGHLYTVIGRTFDDLGQPEVADSLLRLALPLLDGTPRWADAATALGAVLAKGDSADFVEAESLFRRVLTAWEDRQPRSESDVANAHADVAFILWRRGEFEGAAESAEQSVALHRTAAPPDSAGFANALKVLGDALESAQRVEEAEVAFREMLGVRRAVYGAEHPSIPIGLNSFAGFLRNMGRYDEALPYAQEARAVSLASLGPSHPNTLDHSILVASILRGQGNPDEAIPLIAGVIDQILSTEGPGHPYLSYYYDQHARALMAAQRYDEAATVLQKGLVSARATAGTPSIEGANLVAKQAAVALAQGDAGAAVRLYRAAADEFEEVHGSPENPFSAGALNGYGQALVAAGRVDEAGDAYRESIAAYAAIYGPDHEWTVGVRDRLAALR